MSRDATLAALDVSRETTDRLDTLVLSLGKWNAAINLVAQGSLPDVWRRHVLDSGQLWRMAPETAQRWVDLGSGGGFPALVVAAIAAEQRPSMTFRLVESDRRKAVFLRETARVMGVVIDVDARRIEQADPDEADVVSARALAPLDRLLSLSQRFLAPGGVRLFLKGARVQDELTEARRSWHIQASVAPSLSEPSGAIVVVTEAERAADRP